MRCTHQSTVSVMAIAGRMVTYALAWLAILGFLGCGDSIYLSMTNAGAAWQKLPVPFPVRQDTEIAVLHTESRYGFDGRQYSLPIRDITFTVQADSACALVDGPDCTQERCAATFAVSEYGICLVRVDVRTDAGAIHGCWYQAILPPADEVQIEREEATIQALVQTCEDR